MNPQRLLGSLDKHELLGLAEALPAVLAEQGIEQPASWVGQAAVATEATITPTPEASPLTLTWEQQLEELSAEQKKNATAVREALVSKYESKGYSADDFSLVKTTREADGETQDILAVALNATKGIDLGNPRKTFDHRRSWDSIDPTKPQNKFTVEVNGKKLDERAGLNLEVMRELAAQNPNINEWVWETGRPDLAANHRAPIVGVRGGDAGRRQSLRGDDYGSILFRPAVVLG